MTEIEDLERRIDELERKLMIISMGLCTPCVHIRRTVGIDTPNNQIIDPYSITY